jgi:hypothetical protein
MNRLPTLPKDCKNLGDEIIVAGIDMIGQRKTVAEAMDWALKENARLVHLGTPRPGMSIFRLEALRKKNRREKK